MKTEQDIDGLVSLLCPQPIIDIKDVVIILIVITFVVRRLARFCENPPWVMRRLILELGVAYAVGIGDVGGQLTQRLRNEKQWSLSRQQDRKMSDCTDKNVPDESMRRDAGRVWT